MAAKSKYQKGKKYRPGAVNQPKGVILSKRVYTQGDLYRLARRVGLSKAKAKIAAAVAMAESGGRVDAHNTSNSDGSTDTGLWQINSIHGIPVSKLKNPLINAKAMRRISSGGSNWTPWVAFTSGRYKQFMGADLKDAKNAPAPTGIPSPQGASVTGAAVNLPTAQQVAFEGNLPGTTSQLVGFNPLDLLNPLGPAAPNPLDLLPGGDLEIPGLSLLLPQQIEDFFTLFNRIFEPRFWFQVGKVALGLTALYIGVNSLIKLTTGIDPTKAAKNAAGTAVAVAATKGVGSAGKAAKAI